MKAPDALTEWRLCDPDKFGRTICPGCLILQPPLDLNIAREPERRQEHLIKLPRLGKAAHSEINVIETPPHKLTQNRFLKADAENALMSFSLFGSRLMPSPGGGNDHGRRSKKAAASELYATRQ